MLVYFSGSARDIGDDITTYRSVVAAIQESGGIIALNWTEVAALRGNLPSEEDWWKEMCATAHTAIEDADAVIVEVSGASTFGVGYELAQALAPKKTVLALIKKENTNSYARGINHPCLQVVSYTPQSIGKIVGEFLSEVGR